MVLPELMGDIMGPGYEQGKRVEEDQRRSFAITGIEAHICVSACEDEKMRSVTKLEQLFLTSETDT